MAPGTRPPQAVSIDGTNMALHLAVDRDHDQIDTTTCRRAEARADRSCWRRSGRTSEPNTAQTKRTILPAADFCTALQRHNGAAPLAGFITAINSLEAII
jgi:hypothetical protein